MAEQRDLRSFLGLHKTELPTPALLIDLDALEANIATMAAHAQAVGINLRPHAKSHKCPEIAKRQMAAGAVGVCAATISEAEVLVEAGIASILITSPMAGGEKIARLVRLTMRQPEVMAVVDNASHAAQLSQAAADAQVTLNVLVDIDPGMHRTGIPAGEGAVALAELIARLPHLRLRGLQCYSGTTAHVVGFEARRAHSSQALTPALELFAELRKRGLPIEIMTGGSTGTYNIDCALPGMTELQVGSYVFMDIEYRDIGGKDGPVYRDFAHSLTVLSTVVSKSHAGLATVDAGIKGFATDRQFGPEPKDITGVTYHFGGDEHGILSLAQPSRELRFGDKLEFLVPHCDPNVNLYDRVFCVRGDRVEAIWPIVCGYR